MLALGVVAKSTFVDLLVTSKHAIHLASNIVRKGDDAIFFTLADTMQRMQIDMLGDCKYANPVVPGRGRGGRGSRRRVTQPNNATGDPNTEEGQRMIVMKQATTINSFKDTSHIDPNLLYEERKNSRLFKWQEGGSLILIDTARNDKVCERVSE